MKSIEFTEEQLKDLGSVAGALFDDPTDPRSMSYNRVLVRPEINWFVVCLYTLLPPVLSVITWFLLCKAGVLLFYSIVIPAVALLAFFILTAKRAVICAVKIYQRLAPESIRRKCRFEPSCSEYMILAIEKYGLVKGALKGIDRLRRCNIKDGGFDMP